MLVDYLVNYPLLFALQRAFALSVLKPSFQTGSSSVTHTCTTQQINTFKARWTPCFSRTFCKRIPRGRVSLLEKMLELYIHAATVPDVNKLQVLFVLCGAKNFPCVKDCTCYSDAITIFDKKICSRSTAVMMRHKLRQRKQQPGESVKKFIAELKILG